MPSSPDYAITIVGGTGDDRRAEYGHPGPQRHTERLRQRWNFGRAAGRSRQRFPCDDNDDGRGPPASSTTTTTVAPTTTTTVAPTTTTTAPVGNGVTVTPTTNTYGGYGGQDIITLSNTKAITVLIVTINVARTTGVTTNGGYNSLPGGVGSAAWSTGSGLYTYTYTLNSGHHTGSVLERAGRCSVRRTGSPRVTSGDTWSVVSTSNGVTATSQRNALGLVGSDDALSGQLVDLPGRVSEFGEHLLGVLTEPWGRPGRSRPDAVEVERCADDAEVSDVGAWERDEHPERRELVVLDEIRHRAHRGTRNRPGPQEGVPRHRRLLEQAGLQQVVEGVPIGHSVGVVTVGRIGGKIREAQDVTEPANGRHSPP